MNRRDLLVLGGAAYLARPASAEGKRPKIGFLSWFPPSMQVDVERFQDGMKQLGYIEGKNYEFEAHLVGGNRELAVQMAREMVNEPVDILVAVATPAAHVAKETTQTIPIVMLTSNALSTGLVPSLSHPGGNITGVSLLMTDLAGKRLELLHEIRPSLRSVSFLGSSEAQNGAVFARETQAAADRLGVALSIKMLDGPDVIDQTTFDQMKKEGSEALVVQPIFTGYQDKIIPMAMKAGIPVIADWAVFADAGALLTYGADQAALIRRLAVYVDRILKGTRPADLPIEQPAEFEFVINLRTAAQLGWTVPQMVLIRADRVIE
jgi:putative tryptophan/tyrosine transport system substrate-binding protein